MVISSVIWETQSTFISGRQILDEILIAKEIVNEEKRKKKEVYMFKVAFEKIWLSWPEFLIFCHVKDEVSRQLEEIDCGMPKDNFNFGIGEWKSCNVQKNSKWVAN